MKDLTIIIPTINEEKTIGTLIKKILEIDGEINIIVCDDGSLDNTREIVLSFGENVKFVDRKNYKEKGLTASVITGTELSETENIIVMDGDMQHPPGIIKEIYEKFY